MKFKTKTFIGLILLNTSVYATELQYSISLVENPENYKGLTARDINDHNQVVGSFITSENTSNTHAFISSKANNQRTFIDLGSLGENQASATAINNSGILIGQIGGRLKPRAFIAANTDSGWTSRELFPDFIESNVFSLNNSNQITGLVNSTNLTKNRKPIVATLINNEVSIEYFTPEFPSFSIYTPSDNRTAEVKYSTLRGINDAGQMAVTGNNFIQVVGHRTPLAHSYVANNESSEWLIKDLGDLLYPSRDRLLSTESQAINNNNQIVGYGRTLLEWENRRGRKRTKRAFVSTKIDNNWVMTNLGTSQEESNVIYTDTVANDINDNGLIVGFEDITTVIDESNETTASSAIIYDTNRKIHKLFDLVSTGSEGWTKLNTATAINASGLIVGNGIYNGADTAYILTPIDQGNSSSAICEVGLDPQTIKRGEGTALWWWSDAVVSGSINNGIGSLDSVSSYKWIYPTATTTYTMTANGEDGNTTTCEATIIVEGQTEQSPAVCELGADPKIIRPGQGTALWWWSGNATSANIDNNIGSVTTPSDYTWFYPTQTTTYTMNVVSAGGVSTSCQTTITVQ